MNSILRAKENDAKTEAEREAVTDRHAEDQRPINES